MRMCIALLTAFVLSGSLASQDQNKDVEELKKQVDELRKRVDELSGIQQDTIPEKAKQEEKKGVEGIYSKPFLARAGQNVTLGGYFSLEYGDQDGKVSSFDQYRLVPFIYADVTDRVKFATEIEYEHTGSEIKVEFAIMDLMIEKWFNFRAGAILMPLGKFNLVHDDPINELTKRPLVSQHVFGSVYRDPGVGFWGRLLDDSMLLDYEVYVTNGFKGLDRKGNKKIDTTDGIRKAGTVSGGDFGSAFRDFNDDKALTGRIMFMPYIGIELGVSSQIGKYDQRSDNDLRIYGFDWDVQLGGISQMLGLEGGVARALHAVTLKGEYGYADIHRDAFAKSKGVPNDFHAWYAEMDIAIMPDFLNRLSPEAQFTFVIRYDREELAEMGTRIWTPGINLHVSKYTKIKIDYQIIDEFLENNDVKNNIWWFSVATYL